MLEQIKAQAWFIAIKVIKEEPKTFPNGLSITTQTLDTVRRAKNGGNMTKTRDMDLHMTVTILQLQELVKGYGTWWAC